MLFLISIIFIIEAAVSSTDFLVTSIVGQLYFLNKFLKLDLRIDKRWNFKSTSMNFYIDAENLLANEIPVPPEYGLLRDSNQNVIIPRSLIEVESDNRTSIIPSVGFVFYF